MIENSVVSCPLCRAAKAAEPRLVLLDREHVLDMAETCDFAANDVILSEESLGPIATPTPPGVPDMLMATGTAFRGLATPSFMDNLLRQAGTIRDLGMFFGPIDGDKKAPTTATRDMGAVAARLLADRHWTGREEVAVLGPEDLSMNELAAIAADVLGREVRYQQVPFDAFKAQLLEGGVSESLAKGYVDMVRAKDEGMDVVAEPAAVTRTPTSFREWAETGLKPAVLG